MAQPLADPHAGWADLEAQGTRNQEAWLAGVPLAQRAEVEAASVLFGGPPGAMEVVAGRRGYPAWMGGVGFRCEVTLPADTRRDATSVALAFIDRYRALLGMDQTVETLQVLQVSRVRRDSSGGTHVEAKQWHHDVRVFGAGLSVRLDEDLAVTSVPNRWVPDLDHTVGVPVAMRTASEVAFIGASLVSEAGARVPQFGVFDDVVAADRTGAATTAWRYAGGGPGGTQWLVYIDDASGEEILRADTARYAEKKEVYFGNNQATLPGILMCRDTPACCNDGPGGLADCSPGQPRFDASGVDSKKVWDGTNETYDYYDTVHDHQCWDGTGNCVMKATSDYGGVAHNGKAQWVESVSQAWFGEVAACTDIVGHEFMHAVAQTVVDGGNFDVTMPQSMAIGEHVSDVLGEFIEKRATAAEPDWLEGTGALPSCSPIRSLIHPPAYGLQTGSRTMTTRHRALST